MTPTLPAPPTELTPFLLQQAGLRASLLHISFGHAADDWEDLRQDLALDCLRRLPNFDPTRGDWRQFVHGVVRNHAHNLASRALARPLLRAIETRDDPNPSDDSIHGGLDASAADFRPGLELQLDVSSVLTGLPPDLQSLARLLSRLSVSAVRRQTGLTASQFERKIRHLRAAFSAAGLGSSPSQPQGGQR